MEAKRIFVVEDDGDSTRLIRFVLEKAGHTVVDEVYWVAAAMNAIGGLTEQRVDVITLDQDIHGGDIVKRGFIQKVRAADPNIKIIGLSCSPMEGSVDYDLGKCCITKLPEVIEKLFEKK